MLKIDAELDEAIRKYEKDNFTPVQLGLFDLPANNNVETRNFASPNFASPNFNFQETKSSLLDKLEQFLSRRTSGDDLGLRLRGEQLAAGIRFNRMARENTYDLVIGNPPYQGTSKMVDAKYVAKVYPRGKADLYAAFLERGLQLVKNGGMSALLTMRGWMFLQQFTDLREWLLQKNDLRSLGDVSWGAFSEMRDNPVTISIICNSPPSKDYSVALAPTDANNRIRSAEELRQKIAGLLCGVKRFEFLCDRFHVIKEKPLIYWWDEVFLKYYAETPKIEDQSPVRQGMATGSNNRYLRNHWEVFQNTIFVSRVNTLSTSIFKYRWIPYIKDAADKKWFEPLSDIIDWQFLGCCYAYSSTARFGRGAEYYFKSGVAFSRIGNFFSARLHCYRSIIDNAGSSVYPNQVSNVACLMNSRLSQKVMSALNPTVNFQVGDVNRLPIFPIESAEEIFTKLETAFTEHEAARETSVEFKQPGASAWNYTQQWAQTAVDREPNTPLPDYQPVYEQPPATNFISYAIGIALNRFAANGEGILSPTPYSPLPTPHLPHSILYLSTYSERDSLEHPTTQPIHDTWQKHGAEIAAGKTLPSFIFFFF